MPARKKAIENEPNREELFQMAVQAVRNGQKQGARMMFRKILSEDRRNTRAMMWLAKIARTKEERRQWLNRVLDVEPDNRTALDTLDQMDYRQAAERNRMLLRVGIGAYVMIVILGAVIALLLTATASPL